MGKVNQNRQAARQLEALKKEIEQKRMMLIELGKDSEEYSDTQLIEMSQALDELIVAYMHVLKKGESSN